MRGCFSKKQMNKCTGAALGGEKYPPPQKKKIDRGEWYAKDTGKHRREKKRKKKVDILPYLFNE